MTAVAGLSRRSEGRGRMIDSHAELLRSDGRTGEVLRWPEGVMRVRPMGHVSMVAPTMDHKPWGLINVRR